MTAGWIGSGGGEALASGFGLLREGCSQIAVQGGEICDWEGPVRVGTGRQQRADHQLGMLRPLDRGDLAGIGNGRGEACLDP